MRMLEAPGALMEGVLHIFRNKEVAITQIKRDGVP